MMGNFYGMMGQGLAGWSFFGSITWILLILFLALGCVYFWQQINKRK